MKVTTTKKHRFGLKIDIAGHRLTFSKDGVAEITEEAFEKISATDSSIVPVVEKGSQSSSEDDKKDLTANTSSSSSSDEIKLSDMSVKELKGLAEESKLPKKEWERLNKEKLIEYISGKLK